MRSDGRRDDPYIGAGIGLAVVLFVLYVYPGFLIPLSPHFDGGCTSVPLEMSAEDLAIDPGNGLAYLTYYDSIDGQTKHRAPASATGTVMLIDLNNAEPHVRAALSTEPADFKPSGLSLFTGADGTKRLFVTSRSELGKHSVEIFDRSATGAFTPTDTIHDPLLWSPAAIVAVGARQFYVVNQLGFKQADDERKPGARGRLHGNQSTVVYYDGKQFRIVASRLSLASGIAATRDGRTVYVSEAARGRIRVFERDISTGELKQNGEIDLPSAPHNITVDADGVLWVSAHPHAIPFMEFLRDPDNRAPTQVLKVVPGAADDTQVEEIYLNEGDEISAGTVVAARGAGRFVVGSRSDHKLLMCTMAGPGRFLPADANET